MILFYLISIRLLFGSTRELLCISELFTSYHEGLQAHVPPEYALIPLVRSCRAVYSRSGPIYISWIVGYRLRQRSSQRLLINHRQPNGGDDSLKENTARSGEPLSDISWPTRARRETRRLTAGQIFFERLSGEAKQS